MLEQLNHIDTEIFLFLNGLHNSFFDTLMYWISAPAVWLPLYLFFIYLFYRFFKTKFWLPTLVLIITVGLADWISVHAFKEVFMRLRPCHDPALQDLVHIVRDHCGGKYGFVSSHAANIFAVAGFMFWTLRKNISSIGLWVFGWGILVGYSRIYLGVHYPGDVLAGALLGILLSSIAYFLLRRIYPSLLR
jgi:undecaprenyl-diphosphatase